jgi:hypothetical protein
LFDIKNFKTFIAKIAFGVISAVNSLDQAVHDLNEKKADSALCKIEK